MRFGYYLALGMVATVNPCGFAMLPAYLSYFLGNGSGPGSGRSDEHSQGQNEVLRAVWVALAVSGGFMAVFALAGLLVRATSLPVYEFVPWISLVIGLALTGLGLAMLGGFELALRLPKLERGGRDQTVGSMFVFGVSYAIASIGCTLPLFMVAVVGTIDRDSFSEGVVVFATYAAGMALILTALTVTMALARTSVVRFLHSAQPYINRVSGGLVTLAGLYVVYYAVLELRTYRSTGGVPSSSITDVVAGWSYDISDWIDRLGPINIALAIGILALAALAGVSVARARTKRPTDSTTT